MYMRIIVRFRPFPLRQLLTHFTIRPDLRPVLDEEERYGRHGEANETEKARCPMNAEAVVHGCCCKR